MNWYINRTADIMNGDRAASRTASIMPLAYPGDGNAHIWRVTVTDNGAPASLTGVVPIGYFMRGYDGETVMQTGTISGNVISVTIPAEAYAYSGHVTAIIRINQGGANMTIDAVAYEIGPNVTGEIIDPGDVIPGIDDLIAEIERMEADTAAAEAAVAQVNDKLAAFDVAIETFYPHSGGVGNIVTVEGTVDAPPAELIIYGRSVQDGTPAPDAPVDIVTAGSGGTLAMVSAAKNLIRRFVSTSGTGTGCSWTFDAETGTYTLTSTAGSGSEKAVYAGEIGVRNATGQTLTLSAESITGDSNASVRIFWGNTSADHQLAMIYGSTLSATFRVPNEEPLIMVLRMGNATASGVTAILKGVQLEVGSARTDFAPMLDKLTAAIDTTPNGLPGIPVASGGNYIDTGETRWICDTIDLEAGTWTKRVQRVTADSFARVNSQEVGSTGYTRYIFDNGNAFPDVSASNVHALCTHFPMISSNAGETGFWVYRESSGYPMFCFHFPTGTFDSNAAALAYMKTLNSFELYYPLAAPEVVQLTTAQLTALRSLRGRKGQTNLYSADPAGPEFWAEMYIDIPTYINSIINQRG